MENSCIVFSLSFWGGFVASFFVIHSIVVGSIAIKQFYRYYKRKRGIPDVPGHMFDK